MNAPAADRPAAPSRARLWAGIAIAPMAWSVAELAGYIGSARGCWPLWNAVRRVGPASSSAWALAVGATMLVVGLCGLAIAVTNLRALPDDRTGGSRKHFMAVFGTGASGLFVFGIVLFALPPIFNHACVATR